LDDAGVVGGVGGVGGSGVVILFFNIINF
jgi:hypothetical protein